MKDYRNTKDQNSISLKKKGMLRGFTKISPQKKTILSLSSNAGSPISSRKGNVVRKGFSKWSSESRKDGSSHSYAGSYYSDKSIFSLKLI